MNVARTMLFGGLLITGIAPAAQPDPASLDPAVDTSKVTAPSAPAAPAAATPAPRATAPARPAAKPPASRSAADRVDLDATQITGNRELPRVLYVVPWKKGELGDVGGRPANSLLEEVLTPVDRDVFRRQNRYYDALKPDAASAAGEGGANPPR